MEDYLKLINEIEEKEKLIDNKVATFLANNYIKKGKLSYELNAIPITFNDGTIGNAQEIKMELLDKSRPLSVGNNNFKMIIASTSGSGHSFCGGYFNFSELSLNSKKMIVNELLKII